MSEKSYMLTDKELRDICEDAKAGSGIHYGWLMCHEHRERTCRMTRELDGLTRGWWRCSECDGVAPAPDKFSFCPYCGAKVVGL